MAQNEWESAPIDKTDPSNLLNFGRRTGSIDNFKKLDPNLQQNLIDAAEEYFKRTGQKLQVNSSYRSVQDQKRLYDESISAGREGFTASGMPIAKPGQSKHQSSVAVDIQQGRNPIAQEILSQYGLKQTVKNDPVHFEFAPVTPKAEPKPVQPTQPQPVQPVAPVAVAQPQPAPPAPPRQRGRIGPQPGGFMGAEGPGPTLADFANAVKQGGQNLATLTNPLARGATFGASVYPEAAIRQQPGESYQQALARTRQIYEQQGQAFPAYQIGGELVGGLVSGVGAGAGLTKAAAPVVGKALAPVVGQTLAGAGGAGTTTYTATPETTAQQAGIAAGVGGAIGGGATAVTALGNKLVNKLGQKTIREGVESALVKAQSENAIERTNARSDLTNIFYDRYKQFQRSADKPQWQKFLGVDDPKVAKDIAKNMSMADFARLTTQNVDSLNFAREAASAAGTAPRAGAKAEQGMANILRLRSLAEGAVGQQMMPATLGGLGGALYGGAMGYDPTTTGFGGALAGAMLGPRVVAMGSGAAGAYALTPAFQRAVISAGPAAQAVSTPIVGQAAKSMTAKPANEWESAPIVKD
jgi:hypothetical protein